MSDRTLAILATLTLASCYSAARFEDQYLDARCDWYTACYPEVYTNVEVCEGQLADERDRSQCELDEEAARACVDAWEALACPDGPSMPDFPSDCDAVYACPGDETGADTDTDT